MQKFQTFYSCNHSHLLCLFFIWNQSFSHLSDKSKKQKQTASFPESSPSWFLHWESLLTGSALAAPIGIRLPHNLIHDHWRGAGKPEKHHKMFEQDTRWQYISFHSCCMQCARSLILRKEKQISTKDSQRGDIWVETWRNSEVHHVYIWGIASLAQW